MNLYFYMLLFSYCAATHAAATSSGETSAGPSSGKPTPASYTLDTNGPFPFITLHDDKNDHIYALNSDKSASIYYFYYPKIVIPEQALHNPRLSNDLSDRKFTVSYLQGESWTRKQILVVPSTFAFMPKPPYSTLIDQSKNFRYLQILDSDSNLIRNTSIKCYQEVRPSACKEENESPLLLSIASYLERFPAMRYVKLWRNYDRDMDDNDPTFSLVQNSIGKKYPDLGIPLKEKPSASTQPLRLLENFPPFPTQCVRSKESQTFSSCLKPLNYLNCFYPQVRRIIYISGYPVTAQDFDGITDQGNLFVIYGNEINNADIATINERFRSSCSWPRLCIDKLYAARYPAAFFAWTVICGTKSAKRIAAVTKQVDEQRNIYNALRSVFQKGIASPEALSKKALHAILDTYRNKKHAAQKLNQLRLIIYENLLMYLAGTLSVMACTCIASVCAEYFFGYRAYQPSMLINPYQQRIPTTIPPEFPHEPDIAYLEEHTPDLNPETETWFKQNQRIAATVGITGACYIACCYYLSRMKTGT